MLEKETSKKIVWVLNRLPGFGIQKFKVLQNEIGGVDSLIEPDTLTRLRLLPHWGPEFTSAFESLFSSEEFEREVERCSKDQIKIISLIDSEYPKLLQRIYDPPLILYVRGTLIPEDEAAVAIVGTRHPTVYGLQISNRFASELAEAGVTVISGFARGIDGGAHRGAVRAKGRTVAVLGCGLDVIYPKDHASLYDEIAASGALVSEFPLGTEPRAFNFPKRNRVISGLSMGVLVVEASERSGSLITARLAAEEGREVYAIPGPIDSMTSSGVNRLIQDGAKLVICVQDILEDLAPQIRATVTSFQAEKDNEEVAALTKPGDVMERQTTRHSEAEGPPLARLAFGGRRIPTGIFRGASTERCSAQDDPVLNLLTDQPRSFDELVLNIPENPSNIRSHLTQLELKGAVKRIFGGRYIRT